MSAGTVITEALQQNLLGNIEKAIIEIIDIRDRMVTEKEPVSAGGGNAGGLSVGTFSGSKNVISMDSTFAGASALTDTLNDKNLMLGGSSSMAGVTQKLFHVQFNPSSLQFTGYGGGMISKMDYTSPQGMAVSFEPAATRITMNVSLIFDKVDPQDAFMADKLNTAPTAVGTGIVKAVKAANNKADRSVQTEVEGFIAALRSPRTTRLTFHWGKMNYTGILSRVSAQYTMFNVLGVPVRAQVNLSMVCADQEISASSMGAWQDAYKEAFGGKDSVSHVQAAQKVGNLLNFTL